MLGRGYEDAFHQALMGAIRPGDVVWDVGANVGHYTALFAGAAAPGGKVIAFEPSPRNREALAARIGGDSDVTVVPCAMGDAAATMRFSESGEDDDGVTSKLSEDGEIAVEVATGDSLVADGRVPVPQVIKIDVEGFEREVLLGLSATLRNPAVRTVAVEVHFGESAARGFPDAPNLVERLVAQAGMKVRWTDPSHIVATRA
jgi:FkbM family methyltransferase